MAWQLHYTSARSGPTGRAGFQYVATSPGLPAGWEAAAAPYLTYQPPPDDTFPESFGYDLVDGHGLLIRCRYLGRDYSGREGNFFGHAVVAEASELEGLRPIELWDAALWQDISEGAPELDELAPGSAFTPEALGRRLGGTGAYELLAALLDTLVDVLRRGHGRVVLVGRDPEAVACWIALVSYSLPVTLAARLSFSTFSADPESAPQRLVGTTPAVWESLHYSASAVFFLDEPAAEPKGPEEAAGPDGLEGKAEGFGRTVADCWRALDLDGLDTIGELAERMAESLGTDPLETLLPAAASVAVANDQDCSLAALAEATAHCLLVERPIPESHVREAVAGRVRAGEGDLAAALAAVPAAARSPMVAGALDGLEGAAEDVRLRMLTDQACDLLFDSPGPVDWVRRPATGLVVLTSVGRRRPQLRLDVTRTLVELADRGLTAEAEASLADIWSGGRDAARLRSPHSGWSGLRDRLRGGREG